MAQNRNRSNHVKIENLPTHMTDCRELLSHLELAGNVQVGMEIFPVLKVSAHGAHVQETKASLLNQKLTLKTY